MRKKHPTICRIGTSGYQYDHWQPVFYPQHTPRKDWFHYYAQRFDTVEINNTFYHLPETATFERWHDQAPRNFRYALKFSRYGTHLKKLKDPEEILGKFLDRAEQLKTFLGPILVQLPPRWKPDAGRLAAFLSEAPRRHRWAVEFRDSRWLTAEVFSVLETHQAALCIHDMIENHCRRLTTDWTYLRFHGSGYAGSYSDQRLSDWGDWMNERLSENNDIYAYFNNDDQGYAVKNAIDLRQYVSAS
jgi:uncharacterized protein YecE (DUF72 family)